MRKKAFTLIELIMVIVIFGIIATMGAEIIAKLYDNYFRSTAVNHLEVQAEITLEQIAKRLSHRVRGSEAVERGAGFDSLRNQRPTDIVLTWIGVSNESLRGEWDGTSRFLPGWSGVIDFNSTVTSHAARTLLTPGSRLDIAHNVMQALTNGDIGLTGAGVNPPALIPKTRESTSISDFYNNTNNNYTIRVRSANNQLFALWLNESTPTYSVTSLPSVQGLPSEYALAHTAYALVPVGGANDFNLTLRYNYQPWNDENSTVGSSTVLAEHVSTFRFKKDGDSIRLKLCLQDANQNATYNISACKETVVF